MLKVVHSTEKNIVILVSHNMGDIAELADQIIVMDKGRSVLMGTPREVYKKADQIIKVGLGLPPAMVLMRELKNRGFSVNTEAMTVDDAEKEILRLMRNK